VRRPASTDLGVDERDVGQLDVDEDLLGAGGGFWERLLRAASRRCCAAAGLLVTCEIVPRRAGVAVGA
jgi:hypothetical protein